MSEQPPASSESEASSPYVVVARRYRPQTFEELIGQQHVARALTSAIAADRVGHAYLFTGARGVGKTSAARILAKALNCETGPTATPCQKCDICESVSSGDDVDVLEIDGASNRGIDEIRQLRQNVGVRPSRSRFKIYIIDEVHMLTKEAFNALLKTLEEPPEHVKFIFATTDPNKIPITVLSRCQRFDFAGVEAVAIQKRLAEIAENEGVNAEPEALALLARRASGSMRDSQSLLEQLLAVGDGLITTAHVNMLLGSAPAERLGELAQHLVERDAAAALGDLDRALAEGTEVGQLIEQLLGYFRDVMALAVGCQDDQMLHCTPGQAAEVRAVAERLGIETILAIVQVFEQTLGRMRASVHTRTLAEMALVRIANLEDLDSLAEIVATLRSGSLGQVSGGPAPRGGVAPKKNELRTANTPRVEARSPVSPPSSARDSSPSSSGLASSTSSLTPTSSTMATASSGLVTEIEATEAGVSAAIAPRSNPQAETETAATPEPAAGTSIALSSESVEFVWQEVLGRIDGLVSEHAAFADSVEVSAANRLVANFKPVYNFHQAQCERADQRVLIERALSDVVGQPVRVDFVTLRTDAQESAPPAPARSQSRRQMQAEIGQRPFVRKALELFDTAEFRVGFPEKEK